MAKSKFTEKDLELIKNEYINGKSINQIAKDFHSYFGTISNQLKYMGVFKYQNSRWTDDDIEYLKLNYSSKSWEELLEKLYTKSKESIIHKAYQLKIKREIYFWSDEDILILKQSYENKIPVNKIKELLNNKFTIDAILTKAQKIGICQREWWNDKENNLLREYYHKYDMNKICEMFPNRSKDAIIAHAMKLGLVHKSVWNQEELQFLIDNYRTMSDDEIAKCLGKTKDAVRGKRFLEKLYHPISPGIYNSLSEYIRKRNKNWKIKSMQNCSYKCVITGEKFQAIHHLYGMNLILEETLSDLNYDTNIQFDELTDSDLEIILKHFYEVQNKYPLGICLTENIHKQFHNEYGYGDNTPEQFEQFLTIHNYKIA